MSHQSRPAIPLPRKLLTGFAVAILVVVTQGAFGAGGGAQSSLAASTEDEFTLVMVPDTQYAIQNKPELFYAQTNWILDNREALNIPFVLHVGDIIEWPSNTDQWDRAKQGMTTLDGNVPYQIAIGNHDMDAWAPDGYEGIEADRSTDMFNTYFPLSLFEAKPTFGGNYPEGLSDNTYFEFTAGGVDWLVISLKYDPTDDELAWADQVVAAHPDRLVIINSHNYQQGQGSQSQRTPVGDRIWDAVAKKHANVRFVFSGHWVSAGMRVDEGDNGNEVYQIQADYQTSDPVLVNENSYLRVMTVKPQEGALDVSTFSPYCAEHVVECLFMTNKTDENNEFTVTGINYSPSPE